jgi:hypothetical protein
MEVDWDRIENKYTEMPPIYNFHSNNANTDNNYHYCSPTIANATTLVGDSSEPTALRAVPPDGVELQRPHAVESTSDVYAPLQPLNRASKPDEATGSNYMNA